MFLLYVRSPHLSLNAVLLGDDGGGGGTVEGSSSGELGGEGGRVTFG